MLCSEAVMVNQGNKAARAVTLHCRSWGCEICAPRRKRELQALAQNGNPNTFITLTVNPARGEGADDRARMLSWALRKMVKAAKRKYKLKEFQYIAVFEATKKGEPHLHILARVKWIDQAWLSNQMRSLIGAPIVDIRRITSLSMAAAYVAKYIGKDPQRFVKCKRYWTTKGWKIVKQERTEEEGYWAPTWEFRNVDLGWVETCWQAMGWLTERRGGILYGGEVLP